MVPEKAGPVSSPGNASQPVVLTVASLARNGDLLRRAANLLRRGSLVAFPTESSYVLACRADDKEALGRLAALRQRPPGLPWTLFCRDAEEAMTYLAEPSELVSRLAGTLWPGPLTLIGRRSERVPAEVCLGLAKVALRVPGHRLAQALLGQCRCPVVATSARLPSGPAMTSREAVLAAFGHGLEALLEGREPAGTLEPTRLDVAGPVPRLVGLGFISPKEIQRLAGHAPLLSSDLATPARFTRFSPEARLTVVEGEPDRVAHRMKFLSETVGGRDAVALLVTPALARAGLAGHPGLHLLPDPENPEELGRHLFELLHRFEGQDGVRLILVEGLPREGPTADLMERLTRVAHQVINTEDPGYAGQAGIKPRERGPRR